MIFRVIPFALFIACACLPAGATQTRSAGDPASPPVVASVTLRSADTLEVSYRIPQSCAALVFANPGMTSQSAIGMRRDWVAGDDCTDLDFQSIRPRNAACRVLRLKVPVRAHSRDNGQYHGAPPWAQPFGDGVYVHTGAYAVNATCAPVQWQATAPGGTVMVDGILGSETLSYKPADADAALRGVPMLLLPTAAGSEVPPLHADSNVDAAARTLLVRTLEQAQDALGAMLPELPLERGHVLATSSNSAVVLNSTKIGEHVLLLTLPAAPLHDAAAQARDLVAHETAHRAQPTRWNEAWTNELEAIREGGAEFLRLAASLRAGWLTQQQVKDQMEGAINSCLVAAEDQPWSKLHQRNVGRTAYSCGLTLHLLGLARASDRADALQRIGQYYREARQGLPTNFGHAIECGAAPDCNAQRLTRVLGEEPLATIVQDEAGTPGSLLHAQPGWGPALVEVMVYRHLEQLLEQDCRPGATISHVRGAPRIAPGARCSSLQSGMVAVSAEGLPLFDGIHAVRSSARACRQRGVTVLGLHDGKRVRVACGASVALPGQVWGVDAGRAAELAIGSP